MGLLLVCLAGILDVLANLLLKKSAGFRNVGYGLLAIAIVLVAFYLLSLAINYLDLVVAYASWGAIGIIGTIAGGRILFNERLNRVGYVGAAFVLCAVVLLNLGK